jgi:hypothetical protein
MSNVRYAFLIDECVLGCAKYFPPGRAITADKVGLLSSSDRKVVEKTDEMGCIVVTNNTRDYREEFKRYAEAGGKNVCTDLYGLLIIPNDAKDWKRVFPISDLEKRLRLNGRRIRWRDVFECNLCVKVEATGRVSVEELPRCPICKSA